MRNIALVLIIALAWNGSTLAFQTGQASETTPPTKEERQVIKIKAEVQKRGVGERSRVRVTLKNGVEVKGYISETGETSFKVTNSTTGTATTIAYAEVERVRGKGLSTGAKIGIGAAIGAGAALAVLAIIVASFHGQ